MRFWVLASSLIVFVQISFLIFLAPSWLISYYKLQDIKLQTESQSKSNGNTDANSVYSSIGDINQRLSVIDSALDYQKVIPTIESVLAYKTKDITLTQIGYTVTGATSGSISLSGVSVTRESLVLFLNSLEASKRFTKIDLPISSFTKNRDIKFSITTSIIPK